MKPEWRSNEVRLLAQVKKLFTKFEGDLDETFTNWGGARPDLLFKTDKAPFAVVVKGAPSGAYLSFATWGQMIIYREALGLSVPEVKVSSAS